MVFCAFFNAFLPFSAPFSPAPLSPRRQALKALAACAAKTAPLSPKSPRRLHRKKTKRETSPRDEGFAVPLCLSPKKVITQRLFTAMPCPAAAGNRAGRRRALRPLTRRTLSEKRFTQAVVTVIAAFISMLLFIISARRPIVNGLCAFIAPQPPTAGLSRRYSRPRPQVRKP